jgi:hypothetical protein
MRTLAPWMALWRPIFPTTSVTIKQDATFVNKNMSIRPAAEWWKEFSKVDGAAAIEKQIQSERRARSER